MFENYQKKAVNCLQYEIWHLNKQSSI